MAAHWTIKNYNLFISAAREQRPGLTVSNARTLYTLMRDRLGQPVFRTDVEKHPRIFQQETEKAEFKAAKETAEEFYEEMPEEEEPLEDDEWEIGGKADYAKKK